MFSYYLKTLPGEKHNSLDAVGLPFLWAFESQHINLMDQTELRVLTCSGLWIWLVGRKNEQTVAILYGGKQGEREKERQKKPISAS